MDGYGSAPEKARFDRFATQQHNRSGGGGPGEHGHASTLAASWNPVRRYRLSTELLLEDSYRGDRIAADTAARRSEAQLQLVSRVFY